MTLEGDSDTAFFLTWNSVYGCGEGDGDGEANQNDCDGDGWKWSELVKVINLNFPFCLLVESDETSFHTFRSIHIVCFEKDWAAGFPSAFTNKLDDQPDFWNVVYTPISWQLNDGKQT